MKEFALVAPTNDREYIAPALCGPGKSRTRGWFYEMCNRR